MDFLIYTSTSNASQQLSQRIENYLKEQGFGYLIVYDKKELLYSQDAYNEILEFKPHVAIGVGDLGTYLRLNLMLDELQVPIVGASPLETYFFAQLTNDNLIDGLRLISKKKYTIEEKKKIQVIIEDNEKINYHIPCAINDIAVFPSKSAILLRYTFNVGNELIWRDSSDGFLVATPTGSSGYAFSAGGPLVINNPAIFIAIPINALNHPRQTYIIPDDEIIVLDNMESRASLEIILDGQMRIPIKNMVTFKKSDHKMLNIVLDGKMNLKKRIQTRTAKKTSEALSGLSAGARFIYKILEQEGQLTQKEIQQITGLQMKTIRNNLRALIQKKLVKKVVNLKDTRQHFYIVD